MEIVGYIILAVVAVCWLGAMVVGMIAVFPSGILGLLALLGIGLLFLKVLKDRIRNKEDSHYSKTVEK